MSVKSKQVTKQYYIIRGDNISKKHHDLEQDMIKDFSYKNLDWDKREHRTALIEQILSFDDRRGKLFCGAVGTRVGLTSQIDQDNQPNTIIYSIEKKRLDCVLLFTEKMDENNYPYIYIEYFCANQVFPTKKGGIFFEHFLDSLRGQYTTIILSPSSEEDRFFKSFHFKDIADDYDAEDYGVMVRTLSPISDKNRRRKPLNYSSEDEGVVDSDSIESKTNKTTPLETFTIKPFIFTPFIKKDYYIIPSNNKYEKPKLQMLEKYMIDKRNYKIHKSYNRDLLIGDIKEEFCNYSSTRQGGIETDHLRRHIRNDTSTVIYSIENDMIDCVMVFSDNKREKYIEVKAFCANQTINTKKGGIFFDYFLNSLRGKYRIVMLKSAADNFYESFYFSENINGTMSRTLSPKSGKNRTRKHYSPYTIPGDVNVIYMSPSRVKSARTSRTRKNKTMRKTLSI